NREQDRDGDREREDAVRGRRADTDEHDERRLRRVGDRRQRVGGEDRQCEGLREERLLHLAAAHRPADDEAAGATRRLDRNRHGSSAPSTRVSARGRSSSWSLYIALA